MPPSTESGSRSRFEESRPPPRSCIRAPQATSASAATPASAATQAHSTWGKAIEVPGTAALNKDGEAGINSLSCASPGRCSAGGFYLDGHGKLQAFVVSET